MPMTYGRLNGLDAPVSRLILGCGSFRPDDLPRAAALLDAYVAAGGTALDTAHVYGGGASERALGAWLQGGGRRDGVVIITKGAHPGPDWEPRVTPPVIAAELAESLERLRTDAVDLYLLHRDDPASPVGPIIDCLNEHLAAGRIRAFGASNWTPARIQEANDYAAAHGLRGFSASSPHFALAVAHDPVRMQHSIVSGDPQAQAWYRERSFPLLAWTSQAQGFFSDRADPEDAAARRRFRRYDHEENWERRRRVRELAERRGRTPTQVALAWLLHTPCNVHPIIGPGTVPHLRESVDALEVALSPEEQAWLDLRG